MHSTSLGSSSPRAEKRHDEPGGRFRLDAAVGLRLEPGGLDPDALVGHVLDLYPVAPGEDPDQVVLIRRLVDRARSTAIIRSSLIRHASQSWTSSPDRTFAVREPDQSIQL